VSTFRARRVISRAPLPIVAVTLVAAVVLVVTEATAPLGALSPAPAGAPSSAGGSLVWQVVRGVSRLLMFTGAAVVMGWRARTVRSERAVWRWLSRAAWLGAAACAAGGALNVVDVGGDSVHHGVSGLVLSSGVLLACPLLYQGLVRWNRYGTLTSDPGDWLNGVSAVFTLTALGNLLLPWLHSPLALWPAWQLQLWLLRVSAEALLVGTAATVLVIGSLLSDVRAWALTIALTLVMILDVSALGDEVAATGGGHFASAGWAVSTLVLAAAAVLRAAPPLPRPVTSTAPTMGSLVVLVASISVLVLLAMVRADVGVATAGWVGAWAGLAALGVTLRGVQLIRLLADLVLTRHEALTDELTGLSNRRALDARLHEDLHAARPFSLMVLDLDDFKQVNDRFGHGVGDELLRRTAALLRQVAGADAFTARLGGDEFAIILPKASTADALKVSATLASIARSPVTIDGHRLLVAGSIGVAVAELGMTCEELLSNADAAMYRAKRAGGGVRVHDFAAAAQHREHAQLSEELKTLLGTADSADDVDPGKLVVHYQAQLAASGRVAGAEALVRWQHPRLGLLMPDAFLHLVEDFGLMGSLTTAVMWQAARQTALWHRAGHDLRISVNLSATCLTHPDLPGLVDDVLAVTNLHPSRLVLEITETSIMVDPEESVRRLNELAAKGVDISIDDYGSGHSSLAYLNDLPAAELKIDRSLTQHITANPRTADIVAGTIALAHRLGLRIVAEGVEDTDTLTLLHDFDCDETQGYLHARPVSAETFSGWLLAGPTQPVRAHRQETAPAP